MGRPPTPDEQRPRLAGLGPVECSSSTELSTLPYIIHDVNRYYAELGVSYWATRRELREAYQAKNGQHDTRLTYVFKQLLNPQVRRAYDCTPFGEVFMDRYVADMLKRKMLDHKFERMAVLRDLGVDMDLIDESSIERDIYSEMGIEVHDDTPVEVVDGEPKKAQDEPRPADHFLYSYYLYKVRFPGREMVSRLVEWQRFLVTALAREGIRTYFAVGLHGEPNRWITAEVGYRKVFFLGDREMPTEELAAAVAKQYRADLAPAPATHAQQQYTLAITGR